MKRITLFTTISLAALLAACGGASNSPSGSAGAGSASSSSYDRCTTMVADWNNVLHEANNYDLKIRSSFSSDSERRDALRRAKLACDKFWTDNFGVGPCEVTSNYRDTQKSAEDLRPVCDEIFALASRNGVS